ncbi:hypothetical protein [Fimbriimonas ginsengisoli]|uniref:Uncharacterized protein n=1 Tax=Fimbriimonas ginsengisoli Gsoil 348 TaxID=661478 RepID=A0A068NTV4_FIMGI|nr:hypothetical protein [Fimbriimonas ginsengisoli]AIE86968.1 hypothetical protein OP10G_3600 [Fimbriimonas ginsengisoli Gsoil 348]
MPSPEDLYPESFRLNELIESFPGPLRELLSEFLETLVKIPKGHAGVFQLSNLGHPDPEYAIQYFSEDWSELARLLEDPTGFFDDRRTQWGAGDFDPDWVFNEDIACILQPGLSDPQKSLVTQVMAERKIFEFSPQLYRGIAHAEAKALDDLLGVIQQAMMNRGAFLAEFAVLTRMLTIWYWRPHIAVTNFAGELTPARVALLTAEVSGATPFKTQRFGTLHFDVQGPQGEPKPTDEERAHFIVDCIQGRQFMLTHLNDGRDTEVGNAVLTDEKPANGAAFPKIRPVFHDRHTEANYHGPRIVVDRIPESAFRSQAVRSKQAFEVVISESDEETKVVITKPKIGKELLATPVCFTCCNTGVVETSDNNFQLGDMLLKEYCG